MTFVWEFECKINCAQEIMATNVDKRKNKKRKEIFSILRLKENYIIAPTIDLRRFLFSFRIRFFAFRVDRRVNFTFFRAAWWEQRNKVFEVQRDHALNFSSPHHPPSDQLFAKSAFQSYGLLNCLFITSKKRQKETSDVII